MLYSSVFFLFAWRSVDDSEGSYVQLDAAVALAGPEPAAFGCTLGIACAVQLTGHLLAVSDAIVVSSACDAAEPAAIRGLVTESSRACGDY